MKKVKVGILGAPGYSGEELVRLLTRHSGAEITYVSGKEDRTERIQEIFPYLKGSLDLECKAFSFDHAAKACELVFLCLPHTESMQTAPLFLKAGKRVIDVSADYRLKDMAVYEKAYKVPHKDPLHAAEAVYGLPEINRTSIAKARLVANPGCYPTGTILGLVPGIEAGILDTTSIIIDAKSGVTGAGRKADKALNFSEVNESFKAYKLFEHQHVPEIEQELSGLAKKKIGVTFVPHLLPINRGILCTIYAKLGKKLVTEELIKLYTDRYRSEPFVKVYQKGALPEIKNVTHTNFCDIGMRVDPSKDLAVIVTAIDNLGKGAASQAVQNFNIMSGFDEREGLKA